MGIFPFAPESVSNPFGAFLWVNVLLGPGHLVDWIIVFSFCFEARSHQAALAGLEPAECAMLALNFW